MSFAADAGSAIASLAEYLRNSEQGEGAVIRQPPMRDLAESLELEKHIAQGGLTGKAFSGFLERYLAATTRLRLFLVLAAEGEAALGRYVEQRVAFARAAAERIRREPGFEVAIEPESNIICFRTEGSDDLQLELRRRLLESGRHYLTTTAFRGRRWLRITAMNPGTTLEDIGRLLAELRGFISEAGDLLPEG